MRTIQRIMSFGPRWATSRRQGRLRLEHASQGHRSLGIRLAEDRAPPGCRMGSRSPVPYLRAGPDLSAAAESSGTHLTAAIGTAWSQPVVSRALLIAAAVTSAYKVTDSAPGLK